MTKNILVLMLLVSIASPTFAQGLKSSSDAPIEISAATSLEWNRTAKTYTANGSAIVRQGDMTVASDKLTAHYSDASGATDIQELVASNNVTITSPPYIAYGDKAVYGVKDSHAVLTGKNLRIVTATEKLTARDKVEYFGVENKMTAVGAATATRGTDTIRADLLTAYFTKDAQGKMQVEKMTADNNVTITTAKETVKGDKGVYNITTQKATLTGVVKIFQGENWLEGTRADIDLTTGISKLYADTTTGTTTGAASDGRVKGVFYPKSTKQP